MSITIIRRTVLAGVASAAIPGIAFGRGTPMKVGIVGAGIIGATLAYYLAEAGAEVTLFEKGEPARQATEKSFAWINPHTANRQYMQLRHESIQEWRAADRRLKLGVIWGGSVIWTNNTVEAAVYAKKDQPYASMPFEVRQVSEAELKRLDPGLHTDGMQFAMYAPGDGHVDPVAITLKYLALARQKGANIVLNCRVGDIKETASGLTVETQKGSVSLDRIIIAAGVSCPSLVPDSGYSFKLRYAPEVVAHSSAVPELSKIAYQGPEALEWKQTADRKVVTTSVAGMPEDLANEALVREFGASILKKVAGYWPGLRDVDPGWVAVCYRPMPTDDFPIIGKVPGSKGVYLTVMHSGVTLSPIVGREVTNEILLDKPYELFSPFRPERFATR